MVISVAQANAIFDMASREVFDRQITDALHSHLRRRAGNGDPWDGRFSVQFQAMVTSPALDDVLEQWRQAGWEVSQMPPHHLTIWYNFKAAPQSSANPGTELDTSKQALVSTQG